jgi:acetoin utilization deacetylase AcuC-like enzyme
MPYAGPRDIFMGGYCYFNNAATAVNRILDRIWAFKPAYLIISAGFDTHISDPIGGFKLNNENYISIGKQFKSLNLPTLVCQEGGYNIDFLGDCVKNFLLGLM